MLYPSVQQMTDEKVNRYALVIATAKGARFITDKVNKEHEEYEMRREDRVKDLKAPTTESVNEKAVSISIKKIQDKEFTIVLPDENTAKNNEEEE